MTEAVHFSKQDATLRSGIAGDTNAQEVTQYTVSWTDLTGAGFTNGDDVLVLVAFDIAADSTANNAEATFGVGTTFAGRTVLATMRTESDAVSGNAREQMWMDRRTLVTNENFYVSIAIIATSTPSTDDYCFFIIKLGDLAAGDFRYGEHTASGDQSTTPDDGASVTLPASGGDDWLVIATVDWLVDDVVGNGIQELSLDGNTRQQLNWEGEDIAETLSYGNIGYLPAATSSAVCKVVKSVDTASTHDYIRSAIFALRMEAFADHVGAYSAGPVAMGGIVDTYVQTNTVSLALTATGNVAWFGQTIADITDANHNPYHRIQVDGADIVSTLGRLASATYGTTEQLSLSQFGTISMSSGTRVIDMDCAEDVTITAYNFTDSSLIAFSLALAAAGEAPAAPTLRVVQSGLQW